MITPRLPSRTEGPSVTSRLWSGLTYSEHGAQALQDFDLSEPERDQLMADLVGTAMDTAGQIKYASLG